jgi:hypothetical protein
MISAREATRSPRRLATPELDLLAVGLLKHYLNGSLTGIGVIGIAA